MIQSLQTRCPSSKVILLALLPRGGKANDSVIAINRILKTYENGKTIFYKDFGSVFYGTDGEISREYMPDRLHPSQKGYNRFLDQFLPYFNELSSNREDR